MPSQDTSKEHDDSITSTSITATTNATTASASETETDAAELVSVSSASASPETPNYPAYYSAKPPRANTATAATATTMTTDRNHTVDDSGDILLGQSESEQEEEDDSSDFNTQGFLPSSSSMLLNGTVYEMPLQVSEDGSDSFDDNNSNTGLPRSAQSTPTATKLLANPHRKTASFLHDQFPHIDAPLTLDDSSEDDDEEPKLITATKDTTTATTQEQQVSQEPATTRTTMGGLRRRHKKTSSHNLLLEDLHEHEDDNEFEPAAESHHAHGQVHFMVDDPKKNDDLHLNYPTPCDFERATSSLSADDTTEQNYYNNNIDDDASEITPLITIAATKPLSASTAKAALLFRPHYRSSLFLERMSTKIIAHQYDPTAAATWIGFWAMLLVTCSNYVLMPMRDAIALAVGVQHIPKLTLASTVLAVFSSVPIGWLFEAPDPSRRKLFKQWGLTRGETQGTSLALFYRFFALSLCSYAMGFKMVELLFGVDAQNGGGTYDDDSSSSATRGLLQQELLVDVLRLLLQRLGRGMYIAFFLVVHLMKLHSISLVWGVTTEAMEYEDTARKRTMLKLQKQQHLSEEQVKALSSTKTRLQRVAFVGFGGTVGGVLGSVIASVLARVLRLSGLLVVSAVMLEVAAQLAIELGRIMHKHWTEQQKYNSTDDLTSVDASMVRSASLGSMKRIASGNSLSRVRSMSELAKNKQIHANSTTQLHYLEKQHQKLEAQLRSQQQKQQQQAEPPPPLENEDSFTQRLLRGIKTIIRSRLLMAIFTYNALYASTTVLLSFQRAELVANRNADSSREADTAFLANINMASSVATFVLQASGLGAFIAHTCGSRGTLALMPLVRLMGVMALAYWHHTSKGKPPNLIIFLVLDECCRIMNMAVAKPVRESLWRGLSNEARYEAKPIVDTLANRWGGGSAAFLVSSINKVLDLFQIPVGPGEGVRVVFGFPPVLFLCMIVATWWAAVSADLGQVRFRIDQELKKRQ